MTPEKRAFVRAAHKLEREAAKLVQNELGNLLSPERRAELVKRIVAGEQVCVSIKLTTPPALVITCGGDMIGGLLPHELLAAWTGVPETLQ